MVLIIGYQFMYCLLNYTTSIIRRGMVGLAGIYHASCFRAINPDTKEGMWYSTTRTHSILNIF